MFGIRKRIPMPHVEDDEASKMPKVHTVTYVKIPWLGECHCFILDWLMDMVKPAHQTVESPHEKRHSTSSRRSRASERARSGSVVDKLKRLFRIANEDPDLEDLELQAARYIPVSLEVLVRNTKFSKKELQLIYRGFKQDCPTGIVSAEKFRELYSQFFPLGDASVFARQIFQTMDQDMDGNVNFEEFIVLMSLLSRGTLEEKLQWVFNLYDLNGNGYLTLDKMTETANAIYDMLGRHTDPPITEFTVKDHIGRVFTKMDLNHDGIITYEEFKEVCINDEKIRRNFGIFDTVL